MDCILLRHGIAIDAEEWNGPDKTRPLTGEGKKKVRQVAKGLAALRLSPTQLLSSPLTRARDTAVLVGVILCPALSVIECEQLDPESSPAQFAAALRRFPADAVVLCVGHEPLLGRTASYLLTGQPLDCFRMKKAGAALIHFDGKITPGRGLLCWWLQPSQLRMARVAAHRRER